MNSVSLYFLQEGVQVRREKFGLLFYDYRGPRLYFVPSGDLLDDDFFEGKYSSKQLVESICTEYGWPHVLVSEQVGRILAMLQRKGLIHEQPVC